MDEILENANQYPHIQFIVSLDDLGQPYSCQEWSDLYESLGLYGNDPLIINSGTEHPVWEWFAGYPYSAYAFLDHKMIVRHLLPSPNYDDFTSTYIPELIDRMEGCIDTSACNYDNEAVYDDGSCDFSCQDQAALSFTVEQMVFNQSSEHQKFPETVSTSDGTLHLVWVNEQGSNKNVMYSRSVDNGNNFSEPIQINRNDNSIVAYIQSGPKIKTRDEELLIVYMDHRTGLTNVYLNRSLDNGLTWSDELRISDQNYLQAYPDLEVGPDGSLHLVYYSYNANYTFNSVRYATAPLGTTEFFPSIEAGLVNNNQEPCDCCQPDLEISSNGDLYIAYRNNINNIRDHYLAVKTTQDVNFNQIIPISNHDDYNAHCPSSGPVLEIKGDKIAVGYRISQSSNTYLNYSNLSSLSFTNEIAVNYTDDASPNFPEIALNDNFIHAAWIDYSLGNPDIFYGVTEIGSGELVNLQRMNQNIEDDYIMQKDPKLHWHAGELYCFWSDKRGPNYQLYFRKSGSSQTTGDVNSDGDINILDIVLLVNIILGTAEDNGLADINSDSSINVLDIVALVNIILG